MASGILKSLNGFPKENKTEQKTTAKKYSGLSTLKSTDRPHNLLLPLKENLNSACCEKNSAKSNHKAGGSRSHKGGKLKIFDESKHPSFEFKSVSTQTSNETDRDMITSDQPSQKYWELLAEERRNALVAALEENEQLAKEIKLKDSAIEDMKLEIEQLEEVASHQDYLVSVIEHLTHQQSQEGGILVSRNSPQTSALDENRDVQPPSSPDENLFKPDLTGSPCSHDSDKENKPPADFNILSLGCAPLSDSSD